MATPTYDEELLLHPYICEGCLRDVPMTPEQYRQEIETYGRILCDECWQTRWKKAARTRKPQDGKYDVRSYMCEHCLTTLRMSPKHYRERMDADHRLLCDACEEERLSRLDAHRTGHGSGDTAAGEHRS